jgi:general secretion pathway protein G
MLIQTNSERRARRATVRAAFTLLEILVVVAIIVVLASVGGTYLLQRADEAKEGAAKVQIKTLTESANMYKLNNGDFPPSLDAMAQGQPNGGQPLVQVDQLRDPFGQPYGYDASGSHNGGMQPDIWCNRPGKQIGNWPGGH